MSYNPTNWQNSPSTNTPINAANLNNMEQGIKHASDIADDLDPRVDLVEQRLDNLIPQGTPTEGNAELIDIRVGANGITYPDAGDAVRGQYTELKSALTDVIDTNVNLFDKTAATLNKQMASNGTASDATGVMYTDFIPIAKNETIITRYFSTIGTSIAVYYNSSKTRISSVNGVRDGDYVTYTMPNIDSCAYCIINSNALWVDELMIVKGTDYPLTYKPYNKSALDDSVGLTYEQNEEIDKKFAYLDSKTVNMFDRNNNGIINGYFSGSYQNNSSYRMTNMFELKGGHSYTYKHSTSMGTNYQVPTCNADGTFTGSYLSGSYSDGKVTIAPAVNIKVRFNIGRPVQIDDFVLTETSDYPESYKPYGYILGKDIFPNENFKHPNLSGKYIVFDGDSICRGANDTVAGESYPKRIGADARMEWYNLGVSGGTIAVVSGVSHNLCTYIDTIISNHPNLEYLILEGGTNDADHLQTEGLGTLSDNFDGTYDTSTFYGAIETLFYKAINAYHDKKIGFIVVMKMGTSKALLERRRGYFDAAIKACEKWGIPYLDLWNGCQMNPCLSVYYDSTKTTQQNIDAGKYYADGQHPTTYGYDYLSPIIEEWIANL